MISITLKIFEESCKYYEENFWGEFNNPVLTYITNRGLEEKIIKKNRLGFAPRENSFKLYEKLIKRFNKEELKESHLFIEKWDKFTGYITIPIITNKKIVYFTARSFLDKAPIHLHLNGNVDVPYNVDTVNSKAELIIVESPIDAMILEQEKFSSIASFGVNGFKKKFCECLKNYRGKIVWLFDSEKNKAGDIGVLRSALILQKEGIQSYIGKLPLMGNKTDINDLYLKDKINFENKIKEIINSSVLYNYTDHYSNYLVSLKKKELKSEISEKNRGLVKRIKELDIVDCLSKFLDLKKTRFGAQGFCPLHNDKKSKSLIIYRNIGKEGKIVCFGACGFKGDLIAFFQKYFNLTFSETIQKIKKEFL